MQVRARATLLGLGLVLTLAAASAVVLQNDTAPADSTSNSSIPDDPAQGPDTATGSVPDTAQPEPDTAQPEPDTAQPEPDASQPEPTTTAVLSGVDVEVHAATLGYYEYYWKCLRAPAGCEPGRVTGEGSTAFDDLSDVARTLLQNGLFVGGEDEGDIHIESIAADGDRATVTTCWWTTAVLYLQSPVQGDLPIAQDNPPTSGRQIYEVVRDPVDDVWRVERSDQVGDLAENVNQCVTG